MSWPGSQRIPTTVAHLDIAGAQLRNAVLPVSALAAGPGRRRSRSSRPRRAGRWVALVAAVATGLVALPLMLYGYGCLPTVPANFRSRLL